MESYDARFVIVTNGPIEEALAYKEKVQQDGLVFVVGEFVRAQSVRLRAGFAVNVFLRNSDTVYRTWHTNGRGTEQLSHSFALIDLLPWEAGGMAGLPRRMAERRRIRTLAVPPDIARAYGRAQRQT